MQVEEVKDKWSIDTAIKVVKRVAALGFEALRIYGMVSESEDVIEGSWSKGYETYEDVIDRVSSACWTGMDYFRMWLRDDCADLEFIRTKDLNMIKLESEGVYYVEFAGHESHYFVWIIRGDKILYAGTYGGVCSLTVKEFDKREYRKRFINAMNGSMEDYAYVFQVEPEVSSVGFEWISVAKSSRYV